MSAGFDWLYPNLSATMFTRANLIGRADEANSKGMMGSDTACSVGAFMHILRLSHNIR